MGYIMQQKTLNKTSFFCIFTCLLLTSLGCPSKSGDKSAAPIMPERGVLIEEPSETRPNKTVYTFTLKKLDRQKSHNINSNQMRGIVSSPDGEMVYLLGMPKTPVKTLDVTKARNLAEEKWQDSKEDWAKINAADQERIDKNWLNQMRSMVTARGFSAKSIAQERIKNPERTRISAIITTDRGFLVLDNDGKLMELIPNKGHLITAKLVNENRADNVNYEKATSGFLGDLLPEPGPGGYVGAAQDKNGLWYLVIKGKASDDGGVFLLDIRTDQVQVPMPPPVLPH